MKLYLIFLIICLGFFLTVNKALAGKMRFYGDPDLMEREVLSYIPIGSPINIAKQVMEKNGFKCEYRINETFVHERDDKSAPGRVRWTLHEGKDFLYCDCSKGFLIVEQRWQASIVYRNSIVTEILISSGIIAP
jgi:hypothetical protein